MHEALIWGSIVGIFFAGFTLGTLTMVLHAMALSRKIPIPPELVPPTIKAPPPLPFPSPLPPVVPFAPKQQRVASAATKEAYMREFQEILKRPKEEPPPPPLSAKSGLPNITWTKEGWQ